MGYLNKDKVTPATPANNNNNNNNTEIKTLSYVDRQKEVASLNEKLSAFAFEKGIKEYNSDYLNIKIIDTNTVEYTISKDAFTSETLTEDVKYKVTNIVDPVAMQGKVNVNVEGVLVKSYIMDSQNRLYLVKFYAAPSKHQGIEITEYKVDNIESFIEFNTPIFDEYSEEDLYVIIKTTGEEYYTDYKFDYTEPALTKLTSNEDNVVQETNNTEETNATQPATNDQTNTEQTNTDQPTTNEQTEEVPQTNTGDNTSNVDTENENTTEQTNNN